MDLLERAEHLRVLGDALVAARASGQVALISGEAGVGKSALVEAFCSDLRDVAVMTGRCDDLFAPRPLGPLADIARALGGPLRGALDDGDQQAAFDAFLDALSTSAQPIVVVLEDLQWADDATLDLLRFAARRIEATRALLLATFRDDLPIDHPLRRAVGVLTGPNVHRVPVEPLSLAAVCAMADGRQIDGAALHEATGGNPFFVVEVLAAERWTIPTTVRDAVLARVAGLPGPARDALAATAVLGSDARPDLVMRVAGCDGEAIEACIATGLLDDVATRLAFRHDLSRLAIEGSLTRWRRRALHAAALAALGDGGDVVSLANHAVAAEDVPAVLRLAPRAAAACASLGAQRAAAALYGAAVEHADDLADGQRLELFEAHARACHAIGAYDSARTSGEVVLQLMRDQRADPLREGAWLWWMSSTTCGESPHEAIACLGASLALLEPLGETVELARALGQAAGWAMVRSDAVAAIELGQRGLPMAERFGDEDLAVRFLDMMGSARMNAGDEEGAELLLAAIDRAERAGLEQGVARACNNLGAGFDSMWRPRDAVPWFERALEVASTHEIAMHPPGVLAGRAEAEIKLGQWDEAAESVRLALADPYVSEGDRGYLAWVLGTIRVRRGDPGASECLDDGLAHALVSELLQYIHPVRIARAEHELLRGDVDAARAEIEALIPVHGAAPEPWRWGELALWCHRLDVDLPVEVPMATPFALHIAGRHREAAAIWEERGCRYLVAEALGDSDDEEDLRRALEILHELGAGPRAAQVIRRLRELGARAVPRGPRAATRANPAGLTAREVEVAELLREGLSNAQIAARLVVSTKTVDHHVSSVLAKLAVPSRRDVPAAIAGWFGRSKDGEVVGTR